jgi:hypothetical protein
MPTKRKKVSRALLISRARRDKPYLDALVRDLKKLRKVLTRSLLRDDEKILKHLNEWIEYLKKLGKATRAAGARQPRALRIGEKPTWPVK